MRVGRPEVLDSIEQDLVSSSFGDAVTLRQDTLAFYRGLLRVLRRAAGISADEAFLNGSAKQQIVYRGSIEQAYAALRDGRPISEEIRQGFEPFLVVDAAASCPSPQFHYANIASIEPLTGWKHDQLLGIVRSRIIQAMAREEFPGDIEFLDAPIELHEELLRGLALLTTLAPKVAFHTLSLVRAYALVDAPFSSAYNSEAPLMFMIDSRVLDDELEVADTLMHESLHEKMANIRLTHWFLREGYDDPTSERAALIKLPWPNRASDPRIFSVGRALATVHYYAHSAYLHAKALVGEVQTGCSREEIAYRLGRSYQRAVYIERQLASSSCRAELGRDGLRFMSWLGSLLTRVADASIEENALPAITE